MLKFLTTTAAFSLALPVMANAGGVSVSDVIRVSKSEGYSITQDVDSDGDPMLSGKINGISYDIFFYGCEDVHQHCGSMQFSTAFDLTKGITMDEINAWNRDYRFGKAYVDDEMDPFIEYNITLLGGVTDENLADVIDWWRIALEQFTDHIDY